MLISAGGGDALSGLSSSAVGGSATLSGNTVAVLIWQLRSSIDICGGDALGSGALGGASSIKSKNESWFKRLMEVQL